MAGYRRMVAAAAVAAAAVATALPAVAATSTPNRAGRPVPTATSGNGPVAGAFVPLGPTRVLDTRTGLGFAGPVAPRAAGTLHVATGSPVPANAAAVVLNVAVTAPTASGSITVWAGGTARPVTQAVDFRAGQTVSNLVIAQVGTGGTVDFYNGSTGTVHLVADITGFVIGGAPSAAGAFVASGPNRLLDTRSGLGATGPVHAGATVSVHVTGGAVPARSAAVVLTLTVVSAAAGYVTAWPDGSPRPGASNVNFTAGSTVPNVVVVPVGADGLVDFYNGSGGDVRLVADLDGYVISGPPSAAGGFASAGPTRVLDSRRSIGFGGPLAAHGVGVLHVDTAPLPPGVSAVALNVAVTGPTAPGYLTVWPDHAARPATSVLNFGTEQTIANLVVVPVAPDGSIDIYNASPGTVQVVADLAGYFLGATDVASGWSTRSVPVAADGAADSVAADVVCTSSTQCVAVGHVDNAQALPAGGGSDALASVLSAGAWHSTRPAAPPGVVDAQLAAVSCADATHCTAVGTAQSAQGLALLVDTLAGGAWTSALVSVAADTAAVMRTDVSCPSATSCVALVQYQQQGQSTLQSVVETLANGAWTPTTLPTPPGDNTLEHISCTDPSNCVAVGDTIQGNTAQPLAVVETAGAWTDVAVDGPAGATFATLDSVACSSVTACSAFGSYRDSQNRAQLWRSTRSGTTWTAVVAPPLPALTTAIAGTVQCHGLTCSVLAAYQGADSNEVLTLANGVWTAGALPNDEPFELPDALALSCPDAGCVAVGTLNPPAEGRVPAAFTGSGTTWASTVLGKDAPIARLDGVSCASATACTAVGTAQLADATYGVFSTSLANGSWSAPTWLTPPPRSRSSSYSLQMTGVSCATATWCVAVGQSQQALSDGGPFAVTLAGAASSSHALTAFDSAVSCAAVGSCVAVGYADLFNGTQQKPSVAQLQNGQWTESILPTLPNESGGRAVAVDCADTTHCVAVGYDDDTAATSQRRLFADVLNGTTWSVSELPQGRFGSAPVLFSLSCPTASSCVAAGSYLDSEGVHQRFVETLANGTWSQQTLPTVGGDETLGGDPPRPVAVSCADVTHCTAVSPYAEDVAQVYVLAGGTWIESVLPAGGAPAAPSAVSCATPTMCVAVGAQQDGAAVIPLVDSTP